MRFDLNTLALAVASALPLLAHAEEWTLDSTVNSRLQYDDNYRLTSGPHGSARQLSLGSQTHASRGSESSATTVDANITGVALGGDTGQKSRLDGNLGLSQRLTDERDTGSVNLQYVRDTSFDNELSNTGVALVRLPRSVLGASAGWQHSLTDRLSTELDLSASRVRYERESGNGLSNYRNASLGGGLAYAVTELDQATLSLSHSDFRSQGGTSHARTDEGTLGWSRRLTERSSLDLAYGRSYTSTTSRLDVFGCIDGICVPISLVGRSGNGGPKYTASWKSLLDERGDIELRAERQVTASGAGLPLSAQTLKARFNRQLGPTLKGSGELVQTRSHYLGASATAQPTYRGASASATQALSETLSLEMGYRYARSQQPAAGFGSARSNLVYVNVVYDWAKFSVPR